jgi:hypothetical protein
MPRNIREKGCFKQRITPVNPSGLLESISGGGGCLLENSIERDENRREMKTAQDM